MNHYTPLQFLNKPPGHTVYESRKFSCFSWVSYWFLWAKTPWILEYLRLLQLPGCGSQPCAVPAKTTPGTAGTGAIQTYLAKPRLDILAQTQQGQQFAILALASKDILLMEMLHHLIGNSSQYTGCVFARWRKARFFAQLKFREKLAPSPKVAAWSAAQEHWREENNAVFDGFSQRWNARCRIDTLGRESGDSHRKFGGMMDEWMKWLDGWKKRVVWWGCMTVWWWCGLMEHLVGSRARSWTPPTPSTDCNSSHYLQGFLHPRWCRMSSINSLKGKQTNIYGSVDSRVNVCEYHDPYNTS